MASEALRQAFAPRRASTPTTAQDRNSLDTALSRHREVEQISRGVGPYPAEDRYGLDYLAAVDGVGGNYFDQRYFQNDRGPTRHQGWSPVVETDLAISFLEAHKAERQRDPFALFVSWRPPHWPYPQYPDEYKLYDRADVDLPGNVAPQMADFARREIADYYGCCTGLDAQMGRLLDALDRLELADNTIVC